MFVNKSHALAYSLHTVRTAWLAKNYPAEYMTATMNSYVGGSSGSDRIKAYIVACKEKQIDVLPPSINHSRANFSTDGKSIRFGFAGLRGMGSSSALVIEERDEHGEFSNYSDFLYRMGRYRRLDKRMLEALIYAGVLDEYPGSRQAKLSAMPATLEYIKSAKTIGKQQYTLFDVLDTVTGSEKSERKYLQFAYDEKVPEMDKQLLLAKENEYAGFYITGHPLDEYASVLNERDITHIANIVSPVDEDEELEEVSARSYRKKEYFNVAGVVRDFEVKYTKDGKKFFTFTIEDQTGSLKMVYFNRGGDAGAEEMIYNGSLLYCRCGVKRDDFGVSAEVYELTRISSYIALIQAKTVRILLNGEEGDAGRYEDGMKVLENMRRGSAWVVFEDTQSNTSTSFPRKLKLSLQGYIDLQRIFGKNNVLTEF